MNGHRQDPAKNADDAPKPSERSQRGLDWLNFFVADVQTSFGPFVALYLAAQGWPEGRVGLALTVGGLAAMASQVPGGALVDAVRSRRALVAASLVLIAIGALIFAFLPNFSFVLAAEVIHGSTGGVTGLALTAIALGLVGHRALGLRLGRNRRYNSFGNALTAGLMGLLGHFVSKRAPFLAAAALCAPALFALTRIRGGEIDHARARSAPSQTKRKDNAPNEGQEEKPAHWLVLAKNHRLLVFANCLVLFQFTSASLMPLVSERLARQHQHASELVIAALVIVPQLVAALIATWVAGRADVWGRKPLLLAGFAMLPIRAVLFTIVANPWYLLPIQALDGVTATVLGILTPLVIADVMRGTGRYNFARRRGVGYRSRRQHHSQRLPRPDARLHRRPLRSCRHGTGRFGFSVVVHAGDTRGGLRGRQQSTDRPERNRSKSPGCQLASAC